MMMMLLMMMMLMLMLMLGDFEMTQLKQRLMETEAQMSRILQAMEVVQQKVGAAVADTANLMVCWCRVVSFS